MKRKHIPKKIIIALSILILLVFSLPVYAGEGIYSDSNSTNKKVDKGYGGMEIVPPPIVKDGKTYYWSELTGAYELPIEEEELPFPSMSDDELKKYLITIPSYETSVKGKVKKDTLIFSGPSTKSMVFEDNGIIKGGTKITVFYEELGYYFVESEANKDRGYLPVDQVELTDSSKKVLKTDITALATSINVLGRTPQRQTYNVYSSVTGSTVTGSIGGASREIVDVISIETYNGAEWYYIRYNTFNGYKNGFVPKSSIYIPYFKDTNNANLTKPISAGTYQWDYLPPAHVGVDISGSGNTLKAIAPGTMQYRARFAIVNENNTYKMQFRSFGRHAVLNTTVKNPSNGSTYSLQLLYAHMGSYSNAAFITTTVSGTLKKTFSLQYANSDLTTLAGSLSNTDLPADLGSKDSGIKTKSVTNGYVLGTSGNTGNVTGAHLHFQVMASSAGNFDPFNYVLFPYADFER